MVGGGDFSINDKTMEVEAKKIDALADLALKESVIDKGELNTYVFRLGFKAAYRQITGRKLKYMCTKQCNGHHYKDKNEVKGCHCFVPDFKNDNK